MSGLGPTQRLAPRSEIAKWSTLSRNEVGPLLSGLGIAPLGRRYPWIRIYRGLLGIDPVTERDIALLAAGLVRLGTVADSLGTTPEELLATVRAGRGGYPPLYVLGPRRHLFLKGQTNALISSPRGSFPAVPFVDGHACPRSCLPDALGTTRTKIDALFDAEGPLPAHLIVGGQRRFVVADVARRLAPAGGADPAPPATDQAASAAAPGGGVLGAAARRAAAAGQG